jgi:hypothetical protein
MGPEQWDVTRIISETNTGFCFIYTQKSELKRRITSIYNDYKSNNLRTQPIGLKKYSRKSLTEELSKFIHTD